jgi:hypothetical protein
MWCHTLKVHCHEILLTDHAAETWMRSDRKHLAVRPALSPILGQQRYLGKQALLCPRSIRKHLLQ